MKHIKKIISAVTAAIAAAAISTAALPVNGAYLEKSDNKDFDLYNHLSYNYYDENHDIQTCHKDVYFKFDTPYSGIRYEYSQNYEYAFVTTGKNADIKKLTEYLGSALDKDDIYYYTVGNDQLAFRYSENTDYESLYSIAGVKKVELAKQLFKSRFFKDNSFTQDDEWAVENNYILPSDADEKTIEDFFASDPAQNIITSIIETEDGVEPEIEMFADTGFTVKHIRKCLYPNKWLVYYDYNGIDSYTEFDRNAEKIEGIISSDVLLAWEESSEGSAELYTVEPDSKTSSGQYTVEPDSKTSSGQYTVEPDSKTDGLVKGDANLDGKINIYDAVKIAESIVGKITLTNEETEAADFNGDGEVNLRDAICVAEYILTQMILEKP